MAKVVNAKNKIRRLLSSHCKWRASRGDEIEQSMLSTFDQNIENYSMEAASMISFSLHGLAHVYGSSAACMLLDNPTVAPSNISKTLTYRFWAIKLELLSTLRRILLNQALLPSYLSEAANLVCCLPNYKEEIFNALNIMIEKPRLINPLYLKQTVFEPFAFICAAKIHKPNYLIDIALKPPYRDILCNWDNTKILSRHLALACDYHLSRSIDRGGWTPEFCRVPFDILPSEVLLIRRCKAHLGEEMPSVDHPLVQLFDESIGPLAPYEGDPLLAKAIRHCEKVFR